MKLETNMTSGNLFKKLALYTIPFALTSMLQLFYNAADLIVCGSFGSAHSVAAISCTNSIANITLNLFIGLSIGANVLIARCYGKGESEKEKANKVLHTSIFLSVVIGILVGALGFFICRYILEIMHTPDDVIDLSTSYLKIYFIGLPFTLIYNFGSAALRAIGDTKRPFIILLSAGIFNIGLNILFVVAFKMDVVGVAIATVISQAISAIAVTIILMVNKGYIRLKFKDLKPSLSIAIEVVKIGLPAGLQGILFNISNIIIQSSINSLGTDFMDGNGASASIEAFAYTGMNCASQSGLAFISSNYGAGRKDNIKKVVIDTVILVLIINIVMWALILSLQNYLLKLYIRDNDVAFKAATERNILFAATHFLMGFCDLFAAALRGIGYYLTPTIISIVGICGFRLLWVYAIFPLENMHNYLSLMTSYPISWLMTTSVQAICFLVFFKKLKLEPVIKVEEIKEEINN